MSEDRATKLFYDLVWPHRGDVLRVAQILTGSSAEAEDIAQETMLKAFRAIDAIRDGSDIKAWLMTILRNARIDRLRSAARSKNDISIEQIEVDPPDTREMASEWENPQEIMDGFSDQQVMEALQKLPDEIRWTLLLADVEGWDHKDTAAMLEVPVGTIKSRIHRGRAMLRQALVPVARQMRILRDSAEA